MATNDNNTNNDSNEADDNSDAPITEMRFAPDNTLNLDAMFVAMNECQALHPDPQDSFSDGKKIENIFMTGFKNFFEMV